MSLPNRKKPINAKGWLYPNDRANLFFFDELLNFPTSNSQILMRMNRRDSPCGCPAVAAGFHLNTATFNGVEGVARETARVSPTN